MNLLLMGPRGSGKSTLGRLVAEDLGLAFVDLDDRVLDCFEEPTVTDVWTVHGEAAWRRAEIDMLEIALADDGQVIALGGGVPVIDEARRRIDVARRAGEARTVYLKSSANVLRQRLAGTTGDRPSLTGDDPVAEIETVLRQREPTYLALADEVVETGGMSVAEAARTIADRGRRRIAGG